MTLTSYPSSWSLTSHSPLIKKRLSRSDSAGSLPDNILDKRDAKGRTTFFNATKVGDINEAKRLLNAGSDVNRGDIYKVTPLHEAVERSNSQIVEFLVSKGIVLLQIDTSYEEVGVKLVYNVVKSFLNWKITLATTPIHHSNTV